MQKTDLDQSKIKELEVGRDGFVEKMYELKLKKLNIIAEYRKKLDEVELSSLKNKLLGGSTDA